MRTPLGLGQEQRLVVVVCTAERRALIGKSLSNRGFASSCDSYFYTRRRRSSRMDASMKESACGVEGESGSCRGRRMTRVDELRVVFLSTEVSPWYGDYL